MSNIKLFDFNENRVVEAPEDKVDTLVRTGRFGLQKGTRVPVVSPDGQAGTITAEEATEAFKTGFIFETSAMRDERRKEKQFGDRSVEATALGAARGLTFGLSDQALTALGVDREALAEIKSRNPNASLVGEIGAIAATTIASGGTSLLAKGAQKAGAGVLAAEGARVATQKAVSKAITSTGKKSIARKIVESTAPQAAGSAVEGAFFGAGHLVSEEALGNAEFNAESLISSLGTGAIIGGAAGGIFSGGALAVKGATKASGKALGAIKDIQGKISQKMSKEGLDAAEDVVAKEAGVTKPNLLRLKEAADELEVDLTKGQMSGSEFIQNLESSLEQSPSVFGSMVRAEVNAARRQVRKSATEILEEASSKTEIQVGEEVKASILSQLEEKFDPIKGMFEEVRKLRPIIELTEPDVNKIADRIAQIGVRRGSQGGPVQKYADNIAARLRQQKSVEDVANLITEVGDDASALGRNGQGNMSAVAWEARRQLKSLEDRSILKAAKELGQDAQSGKEAVLYIKRARKEFKEFMDLIGEIGKEGKLGRIKNIQQFKEKLGDLPAEQVAKKLFNTKNVRAMRFFREKFPEQFEELRKIELTKIANKARRESATEGEIIDVNKLLRQFDDSNYSPEVQEILIGAQGMRTIDNMRVVQGAFPKFFNPSQTGAHLDLQQIISPLFHIREAARYGLYKNSAKFSDNVQALGQIERKRVKTESKIKKTIKSFFEKTDKLKAPVSVKAIMNTSYEVDPERKSKSKKASSKLHAFNMRKDEIAKLASNPNRLINVISERNALIADAAPNHAAAISGKLTNAVQFLQSKIPSNPAAARSVSPIIRDWEPSSIEIAKFERYMSAVENPLGVLDDLENGVMNREGVETLKAVYPEIYSKVVMEVNENIAELRVKLPYNKKLQLSHLLGVPIDLSMEAGFARALQGNFALEQQRQAAVNPTVGGLSKLNFASRSKTRIQDIQEGLV